jgi:hypothetical protein
MPLRIGQIDFIVDRPTGHSGTHIEQSIQSSAAITRKFGPWRKQSIGQTSTQSVYLHWMQESVTTKGIVWR